MIWIIVTIGFAADLGLAILLFLNVLSSSLYFGGHLLLMLLIGWGANRYSYTGARKRRMRSVVLFAYLIALFIPLIGLITGILVVAVVWGVTGRVQVTVYDEYEEYIFSQTEKGRFRSLEDLAQIEQEVLLDPYIDILNRVGADPRKSLLIDKLSHDATPIGVALLRRALGDRYAEVQQFAAAALGRVEDAIQDEIQKGREAVRQWGRASDYAHLGRLYQRYAGLGLLDIHLSRYFLHQAAEALQVSLEIDFNQPAVYDAYVTVLLDLGKVEEAMHILDLAKSRGIATTKLTLQRGRVDYRHRDFDQLVRRFQKIDLSDCTPKEREVVEFWLEK